MSLLSRLPEEIQQIIKDYIGSKWIWIMDDKYIFSTAKDLLKHFYMQEKCQYWLHSKPRNFAWNLDRIFYNKLKNNNVTEIECNDWLINRVKYLYDFKIRRFNQDGFVFVEDDIVLPDIKDDDEDEDEDDEEWSEWWRRRSHSLN